MKVIINRIFLYGIERRLIKGITESPTVGVKLERENDTVPEILTLGQDNCLVRFEPALSGKQVIPEHPSVCQDKANLGQTIAAEISRNLGKALEYFDPVLMKTLTFAWNEAQKDCSFQEDIIRHLAMDRLSVRLSGKHCAAFRSNRRGFALPR